MCLLLLKSSCKCWTEIAGDLLLVSGKVCRRFVVGVGLRLAGDRFRIDFVVAVT